MNTDVIIKANSHGIRIILSNEYPLENLIEEIKSRLYKYDSLLKKDGNVYISFEGRALSREEIDTILFELNGIPDIGVNFIYKSEEIPKTVSKPQAGKKIPSAPKPETQANETMTVKELHNHTGRKENDINNCSEALFFHGNLLSGQILETKKSIIIIGNVERNARIISGGNIIIIGSLKGEAIAGRDLHPKRFVLALQMEPVHIKIGRACGFFRRSCHKKLNTNDAVIAYCENGQLVFNLLSQNFTIR